MNGGKHGPIQGIGEYGLCLGKFTYFPNGTSDPSLSALSGGLSRHIESITYSATGVQTIVFKSTFGFAGTPRFIISPACTALASSFEVNQIGAYNASTRTLVLQQRQATTGYAAAAASTCFVTVSVFAGDSAGK